MDDVMDNQVGCVSDRISVWYIVVSFRVKISTWRDVYIWNIPKSVCGIKTLHGWRHEILDRIQSGILWYKLYNPSLGLHHMYLTLISIMCGDGGSFGRDTFLYRHQCRIIQFHSNFLFDPEQVVQTSVKYFRSFVISQLMIKDMT